MSELSKKILLLDDDYESMLDLKTYLQEELGWDVELSANKALLQRLSIEPIDLIILDLMIRPFSIDGNNKEVENIHYDNVNWMRTGLEFLKRFRDGQYSWEGLGTPSTIPVLVLSAVANNAADRDSGELLNNEYYVEKPFRLADLVKKMRTLLEE